MPDSVDTIVLIHGLWMTPRSWERWAGRYESRGYKVVRPAAPSAATIRAANFQRGSRRLINDSDCRS